MNPKKLFANQNDLSDDDLDFCLNKDRIAETNKFNIQTTITRLKSQPLHPKQYEIALQLSKSTAKFRFLLCGRNFGKTALLINLILKTALTALHDKINPIYVITQSHAFTKNLLEELHGILRPVVTAYNKGELIKLINGCIIYGFSYANYENLRGWNKANYIFIDEAAKMPDVAQDTVIKQICFTPRQVYLVSTPRGKNQFYRHLMGLKDNQKIVCRGTTFDNPFIPDAEKENLLKLQGTDIYRQEILAEFIDSGGSVFKGTDQLLICNQETKTNNNYYFTGVDIAKESDYTVITTMNQHKEIVEIEKFNQLPQETITNKIINHLVRQQSKALIEKNGPGSLIIEQLQKTGYKKIEAFNTTNDSKQTIINNLRLDLETGKITNCTNNSNLISELIDELISFEFKISTNGNIIYSAPNGLHDDMVMSLALANQHVSANNNVTKPKIFKF